MLPAQNDSLTEKAPKSHAATATTYGAGTASNYGHVKLSDTYASKVSSGAAANSLGASQNALYNAYNKLSTDLANLSEDVGLVTSSSTLDNYSASRNLKGVYQDTSGIQYVFLQIATSVYSVQILIMNDSTTAVRDKVAFRIATGSTFGSTKWSWLSTSSIT